MHPTGGSGLIVPIEGVVGTRMRRLAHIALLAYLSALATAAFAFDNGQYEDVPPDIYAPGSRA
jgi:hypothetical protein